MDAKVIVKKFTKGIRYFVRAFKDKEIVAVPQMTDSDKLLKNKVALITGGSGGIGLAIAENFMRSGCKVIIAGTNKEKLESCVNSLNAKNQTGGGNIRGIVINMLDINLMDKKVSDAADMFPENRIDILVNCAGVISKGSFEEITEEEYDRVMDINMKGTYFMSKAVCKHMMRNKVKGHILNVSSSSALRNAWSPYQISKWAIKGFTKGLADEMISHGIVVNAIAPGPVATTMLGREDGDTLYNETNPAGRYSTPEEIANLAAFMVSDMGDMIVGDTFYITGGSGVITLHG